MTLDRRIFMNLDQAPEGWDDFTSRNADEMSLCDDEIRLRISYGCLSGSNLFLL